MSILLKIVCLAVIATFFIVWVAVIILDAREIKKIKKVIKCLKPGDMFLNWDDNKNPFEKSVDLIIIKDKTEDYVLYEYTSVNVKRLENSTNQFKIKSQGYTYENSKSVKSFVKYTLNKDFQTISSINDEIITVL